MTSRRPTYQRMVYDAMKELKRATASDVDAKLCKFKIGPNHKQCIRTLQYLVGEGKLQFIPHVYDRTGVYVLVEGESE